MKLPTIILAELERLKVSYEVRQGSRHYKIFVKGRFCAIAPLGGG